MESARIETQLKERAVSLYCHHRPCGPVVVVLGHMPAFRISIPLSTSAVEFPESVPDVLVAVEVVLVVTTEPP